MSESGTREYDTSRARLRRHAFALAGDLALSDEERRELAMMLPTRRGSSGPVSWATLTDEEFAVLVHMLDGARLVQAIYRMRA